MAQIKCPNCGTVFQVDKSEYSQILQQVRNDEFDKELARRQGELEKDKQNALERAKLQAQNTLNQTIADKNAEIERLKAQIDRGNSEKELAVTRAVNEVERERDSLNSRLQIQEEKHRLDRASLKEKYENELKLKDEQIDYYKDFKTKLSTKMIGESLEKHCENEFNTLRATAFKNAYFEKDNDARTGSKGDYIYRESDENGVEIISIMFEMKNEMDTTATKHKNEDFFKELDKDRNEKKCEYAVLVTLLESDSELYNNGIVDVSHRYPKMYVIRPQFFIPMITVLRNAALNSLEYKQELADVRNQNIDITHFEESLMDFKDNFSYNYNQAHKRFDEAIQEIDKSIQHLQKIKDALTRSDNQLRIANNKVDDISVKKLTRGNPTMTAMFEELNKNKETEV